MIVVENLEEPGEWLFIEYEHAFELIGNDLLITSAKDEKLKRFLKERGIPYREESVVELFPELPKPWAALDPKGEKELEPEEAKGTIIVGGILGAHPPKGRTWKELTSKMPKGVLVRNIGEGQFSIDGACAVAYLISKGIKLKEIEVLKGLKIRLPSLPGTEGYGELPYWYPVINGKPFFPEKLVEYIRKRELI